MAEVMIGIDPHKGSHTAAAIGAGEEPLGQLRVRTCPSQAGKLLARAVAWPERTWAVEGAAGLGHLLAQQLVADGERVLDVPPKLASRVRLLQAGDTNKNDPNDARSVAVAALRSKTPRPVIAEDFAVVAENMVQAAPGLVPGPQPGRLPAARRAAAWSPAVTRRRSPTRPPESWGRSRHRGRRVRPRRAGRRVPGRPAPPGCPAARHPQELAAAVRASATTVTHLFGVGPVIAGPSSAMSACPASPAGIPCRPTAPPRLRCPPAAGRSTGCRCAATGASTTPSTWPRSPRSATSTAAAAPTTTRRSPRARPTKRPCAASSGGSATRSTPASKPTPARGRRKPPGHRAREGNRERLLPPARPAHTPQHRLFGQATPEPATTLRPAPHADEPSQRRRPQRKPGQPLDSKCKEVSIWR